MNTRKKNRRVLWGITAGLALASLLFFLLAAHMGDRLNAQQEAGRWQGESEMNFAQVSCFVPVDEKLSLEKIYAFRQEIQKALHNAAADLSSDGQLQLDAWSTTGKLNASTELGKGEARVIAVGGDFFQFHPIRLLNGSYIQESDLMKDLVLLDEDLAWILFGGTQLQGMPFRLEGVPFVVGGVVEREQDGFSQLAYTGGMGLYMSYESYAKLVENAGIDCYEFVSAEPVKGFALNLARDKFPIGRGEIVQNTDRFSFPRLLRVIRSVGTRSMQTQGIMYPYWENAARSAEDLCSLYLALGVLYGVFPAVILCASLMHLLKRGKEALTERWFPAARDGVGEAIRKRQRRRWERKHGLAPKRPQRGKHEKR